MNVYLHTPDGGFGSGQLGNAACARLLPMAPATSTSTSSHHININSNIFLDMDIGADGYGHTWLTRNIMEQAFARNIQGIELCKEHHEKINVSS
jgi:hypothetical protein